MTKRKYSYEFSEYRQYKCCRCGRTIHKPTPHICNGQYSKYNLEFWKKIMENEIIIQKENILNAYNQASVEQKVLLENMFGKDMFQPQDIKERIKTFEDACEELGEGHQYVKAYREWMRISYAECKDITAYLKLRIICAALNEGWKPKFDGDECRYYPWFYIYTKEEYEELDEEEKKACRVVGRSFSNLVAGGGLVYTVVSSASSVSYSGNGSRLAFKTRELSEYCGKQFIDIWEKLLFA